MEWSWRETSLREPHLVNSLSGPLHVPYGPLLDSQTQESQLSSPHLLPLLSEKVSQEWTAGRDQTLLPWSIRQVRPISGQLLERQWWVQMTFLVHLPAAAQIPRGGPLQRGSHKRWGDSTAWGPHSPAQPASQQDQPRWHPNILVSPKAEKKWIFVFGGHPPGSDLHWCNFVINRHKIVSLRVSLLLLSSYPFPRLGE